MTVTVPSLNVKVKVSVLVIMFRTVTIKAYRIVEVQRHALTWSLDGSEGSLYPH